MIADHGEPDLRGPGTPEAEWDRCPQLSGLRVWEPDLPPSGRVLVVAPHPDDELLGAGGTNALLHREGARVELVAVTDGEASHAGMAERLRRVRPRETEAAAARMGTPFHRIHRLGHPDGAVDGHLLEAQLSRLTGPGDLVLAPWSRNGHPDHDIVGSAAVNAVERSGGRLLEYLVWAWHWAGLEDLPWDRAARVHLAGRLADRKREAAACFVTQTTGDDPVLPEHVLIRLLRPYEVVLAP